jgi:Pectate lyase superfamily protein/Right handed beta helix region
MAKIKTAVLELVIGDDNPDALAGPDLLENFQKIEDRFVEDSDALAEKYVLPVGGIPKTALEQAVQDTLTLADAEPEARDAAIAAAIAASIGSGRFYDVRLKYNATGDGLADDTAEIQAAIDDLYTLGGGVVFLPIGDYKTTADLVPKSNVSVIGADEYLSTIKPSGSDKCGFRFTFSEGAPGRNMIFHNFGIDGANVTTPQYAASNLKGFFMRYLERCQFRNLYIRNTGATGIGIDYLVDVTIENNTVVNCGRLNPGDDGGGSGIGIGIRYEYESFLIAHNYCLNNKRYGIFTESQIGSPPTTPYFEGSRIIGNYVDGNQIGIGDAGSFGMLIQGKVVVRNTKAGISVDSGSYTQGLPGREGLISGNTIFKNGGSGILLSYEEDAVNGKYVVNNNQIAYNTLAGVTVLTNDNEIADLSIDNNRIFFNGENGIRVGFGSTGSGGKLIYSTIANNRIYHNGQSHTANRTEGIRVGIPMEHCDVVYNKAYDRQTTQSQTHGVNYASATTFLGGRVMGNDFRGNSTAAIANSASTPWSGTTIFSGNAGVAPPDPTAATPGASPWTYTVGEGPIWLFLSGGTVSSVVLGGRTIAAGTNVAIPLEPGDAPVITYSSAPTASVRKR